MGEILFDILVHATIVFTALTIFFFGNEAVKKSQELNKHIDQIQHSEKKDDSQKLKILTNELSRHSEAHNACLRRWSIGVCMILGALALMVGWLNRESIDFRKVFVEKSIVIGCILLFEMVFFGVFASRYQTTLMV